MIKPIAWRRKTKYGWDYRTLEPTEKLREREKGWLPLYGEPVTVPDGWQIVPAEPTEEMRRTAMACGNSASKEEYYCAMLKAAPSVVTPNDLAKPPGAASCDRSA